MKTIILTILLTLSANLFASDFYTKVIYEPIETYYPKFKAAIKKNHMNVLYELDLIKQFKDKGYPAKFGKEFNTNKLDGVKTVLVCNGYVGNQVSNIDPIMMALCPIRVTLIKEGGRTTVVFLKHSSVSAPKKIKDLLITLDNVIINTIDLLDDKYMQNSVRDGGYESIHEGN